MRNGSCSLEFPATRQILLRSRSRAPCSCIAETVGLVSLLRDTLLHLQRLARKVIKSRLSYLRSLCALRLVPRYVYFSHVTSPIAINPDSVFSYMLLKSTTPLLIPHSSRKPSMSTSHPKQRTTSQWPCKYRRSMASSTS